MKLSGLLLILLRNRVSGRAKKYDYAQENLLIDHVAVGVPVGRMRAPFIGLGCNSVDFETEPVDTGLATNPVPDPVNLAAKTEITLPITHENTSILISKLTNNSLVNGIKI